MHCLPCLVYPERNPTNNTSEHSHQSNKSKANWGLDNVTNYPCADFVQHRMKTRHTAVQEFGSPFPLIFIITLKKIRPQGEKKASQ